MYLTFPILGALALLVARFGPLRWDLVVVAVLSLEFFLMALTLYSDYHDYVNGIDRINEHNLTKPLVLGLMRPFQALQLAKVFLTFSFLSALYLFAQQPLVIVFAGVAFGLTYLFASSVFGQRFKGLSSIMSFFLSGPLLVLGLEFLLFKELSLISGVIGFVFGLHAFKYGYVKQIRDIFYNSKAKIRTLSTTVGFEKSKALYGLFTMIHLASLSLFVILYGKPIFWSLVIVSLSFEFYINRLLHNAASFLSSNVTQCLDLQKLHFTIEIFVMIFLLLQSLWFLSLIHI